jgi:hypothetical protein
MPFGQSRRDHEFCPEFRCPHPTRETDPTIRSVFSTCALVPCSSGGSEVQLIASAKVLIDKQDFKGAVIQLKNALGKNPDSSGARWLLGKAGSVLGQASFSGRKGQSRQAVSAPGAGDTWEGGCASGLMPVVSRSQPLHAANPLTRWTLGLRSVAEGG